ncbi:MAG: acylneuraminate cytidylyltransferase family protein [Alphaproteobacteria bacterium]
MQGQTVAFIFARGGSKGLPGKNLRPLGAKPLLAHAIDAARAAESIDRIIVSTDDEEIAAAARQYGAEVPFLRPPELATDDAPEWLAWRHALGEMKAEAENVGLFVSVPTTSPLRAPADIDACVARFREGDCDAVFAVTPAAHNPYFNMVTLDDDGLAHLAIQPDGEVKRRQAAPPVFDITTVCYVVSPSFIERADGLFDGRIGVVEVPGERAVDIDTELDFKIAEALKDA